MIEIKNLQKVYKANGRSLVAVDDASFSIKKGEFISIVGSSGCGKTTLLKLIGGLLKPTEGAVLIDKKPINKKSMERFSFAFQNHVLLPWRTVEENIKLPLEVMNKQDNINEAINLVGLADFKDRYPSELSGGMQQRVNVARALVTNPEVLLMDEPFGSLDELTRSRLNLELLKIQRELGLTIVFVTHSISEAVFLSDKIIVLSKRPAKIREMVKIELPEQRNLDIKASSKFQRYVKCIREKIE